MKKLLFSALALCLWLVGCQDEPIIDTPVVGGDTREISFSTRGTVITDSNIESMQMLCYNTGDNGFDAATSIPNHMYLAKVARTKAGTSYTDWVVTKGSDLAAQEPDKYWSDGDYLSFIAFAPYDADISTDFIPATHEAAGIPSFSYTIPEKMADHKDLTYAITLDQKDNYLSSIPSQHPVSMYFKHALSKVQFKAQLKNGRTLNEGEKVRIAGISLRDYYTSGNFSFTEKNKNTSDAILSSNFINWQPTLRGTSVWSETELEYLEGEELSFDDPNHATKRIDVIADKNALFMIPQNFGTQGIELVISYYHTFETVQRGVEVVLKEYAFTLPTNPWIAGDALTYILRFDPSEGKSPWAAEAVPTDWAGNEMGVSTGNVEFTLTDGKRHYLWSEVESGGSAPRKIKIPFTSNIPQANIGLSKTVNESDLTIEGSSIVYTESAYGSAEKDVVIISLPIDDGEGGVNYRNISVNIGGYELVEGDGEFAVAINKKYYYYSRYSTQSHLLYESPVMPAEAEHNDGSWRRIVEATTTHYTVDISFDYYRLDGSTIMTPAADPHITLPNDGSITIVDDAGEGYSTSENWKTSFGEKKLRLKITRDIVDNIIINVGNAKQSINISLLANAAVTDYTSSEFVNELTGLSSDYGRKSYEPALRVSNCYITPPHADYTTIFYIPIKDRVNEFWNLYAASEPQSQYNIPSEPWINNDDFSLELSWYDGENNGTTHPEITDLQITKNFSPTTNTTEPQNAIMVIQPKGFEEQNYVINVKKGDVIIWSIHCWATKYNPYRGVDYSTVSERTTVNEVVDVVDGKLHSYNDAGGITTPIWGFGGIYGEKFIMDRNLGARRGILPVGTTENFKDGALFYQFGRKDPFPVNKTWGTVLGRISLAEVVNQPSRFVKGDEYNDVQQWTSETELHNGDFIWNDEKIRVDSYRVGKSIFDPSPLGYRIPTIGVWNGFSSTNFAWQSTLGANGAIYSGIAYYPALGSYNYYSVDAVDSGKNVEYVSADPYNNSTHSRRLLYANGAAVNIVNGSGRANPLPIRPIQE